MSLVQARLRSRDAVCAGVQLALCPQPHLQGGRGGKQAAEGVLGNCGHPFPEGKGVGAVIQRLHLQAERAHLGRTKIRNMGVCVRGWQPPSRIAGLSAAWWPALHEAVDAQGPDWLFSECVQILPSLSAAQVHRRHNATISVIDAPGLELKSRMFNSPVLLSTHCELLLHPTLPGTGSPPPHWATLHCCGPQQPATTRPTTASQKAGVFASPSVCQALHV